MALPKVRSDEAAFDPFRAALGAAARLTGDLDEANSRYFALYDPNEDPIAFAGLAGDGPDLLLRPSWSSPRRGIAASAPRSIAASSQFRVLCPASAKLMGKPLHAATA